MEMLISKQCLNLALSLALGFFLGLCYEPLRILREAVAHNAVLIGIQDFFFCIYCTFLIILLCFTCEHGVIRWYIIAGILLGIYFYFLTLGRLIRSVTARLLRAAKAVCRTVWRRLSPAVAAIRRTATGIAARVLARRHAHTQTRIKKQILHEVRRRL